MGRLMVYIVKSGGGVYFVNINVYGLDIVSQYVNISI